jgi:hypothetical protein
VPSRSPRSCCSPSHSQALDVRKAARNTRRLLPNADVGVPPDATHHTIPTVNADRLNQKILQFLA